MKIEKCYHKAEADYHHIYSQLLCKLATLRQKICYVKQIKRNFRALKYFLSFDLELDDKVNALNLTSCLCFRLLIWRKQFLK